MPRYNIVPNAVPRVDREGGVSPCAACPIREIAVCGALQSDELGALAEILDGIAVEAGSAIFYEGDPARHVFNVTTGAVRLSRLLPDGRRQITGFLFPGDFLGLAYDETYTYTAEPIERSALCRFPRASFETLLDGHPRMERRLLGLASNELATAQDQMVLLGRKTAREKLASFLITLSRRAERRGQGANPVHVPMTRTDIADYLGLTIETVSRTFTALRKAGLIEQLPDHAVRLTDSEDLLAIAGD
ncbi:MAG: helix-turn-helix domain-containing protein [Rhodospirillaceae bacterium]|jgi:CRP/FNR family transcriptional regulator, anaerobic regulatory protein|nr:helix-turn-helix domain-containing protein [Rhodospirillaceae bacterium]MBT6119370.1 helix-turn-helix domain-containing protein [Rhodospirillaceae bacterium]